ncbi:M48 family metalloprotease [Streptacidiphilus neutrinimicus]|uniref:M48 family metalloprotease n=1 Tax=Streptacidiphilus neutrinimicus TaxID=105420 RepID=UPI000A0636F7|nr:M48 family metallopeptidase [Streptacidiphilus neutrinimicus]
MTTPTTSENAVCPECSGSLTNDPRFAVWCPSCHWNALPETTRKPTSQENNLRRRLDRALEERLFQEAVSGRDLKPHRDASFFAAAALALPVHLVTLAALVAGGLLVAYGSWPGWVAAAALFGIAYQCRPRLGSYRKAVRKAAVVTRADAPALWALADSVADELGTRRADAIVLSRRFNASYARLGLRRRVVLVLGMPLWASLSEQERVALLAHEFGHGANGDARRGLWLGAALSGLEEWWRILQTSALARNRSHGLEAFVMLLVSWLTAGLAQLVLLYARLLNWLTRIGSRRAEYLADSFTSRLAGTEGATGLLEALRLGTAYESVIHRRRVAGQRIPGQRHRRGGAPGAAEPVVPELSAGDLWTQVQEYVRTIPAAERTRRLLVSELTHDDFDGTHPPTHLRLAFVRSRETAEPAVRLSPADSAAIDAELRPAAGPIAEDLLTG